MLITSGYHSDVYRHENKIEKIMPDTKYNRMECNVLFAMKGTYGIPIIMTANKYRTIRFCGENGKGVYNDDKNQMVQRGKALGLVMNNVGNYTLDDYNSFIDHLDLILFNVCYITYKLHSDYGINHGDLHRRNVVLKYVKPFQKTYYINEQKYVIKNQCIMVNLVDFGSVHKSKGEMHDMKYLWGFISNIVGNRMHFFEDIDVFLKTNFKNFVK